MTDARPVARAGAARLRLIDRTDYIPTVENWPEPPVPLHIVLPARRMFEHDLRRYVRKAMGGRSYLIAGHRGAGKTSLVVDAIEAIRREVLGQSLPGGARQGTTLHPGPIRRPLLVRLYGPSLLEPGFADGPDMKRDTAAKDPALMETTAVRQVLVQITLALYRALAQEVVSGFTAHACSRSGQAGDDHLERAAQLALALDVGADPKVLREMWRSIGRLQSGVLWPPSADSTLRVQQMDGQGLREIIALVTAGQAFQVCSGNVTYEQKEHKGLDREETVDQNARWATQAKTARETIDKTTRLGTVALAAATAIGARAAEHGDKPGALWPVVAGALVWALGTWTLSWKSSTTRKTRDSVEYSFIREPDASTLERDLPLVIGRARDAGLTPVFLIDELDKVTGNGMAEIKTIMRRLKHLVADFGFFCFLVNRHCYGEIEAEIRDKVYPEAHTLFSTRVLLYPDPVATIRFILDQIASDDDDSGDPAVARARMILALTLVHESQFNLNDLSREMSRLGGGGSDTPGTVDEWLSASRQVIATVQIAITAMLQTETLQSRMRDDPTFAHRVFDTAFYISRRWKEVYASDNRSQESEDEGLTRDYLIDCSQAALRTYLTARERPEKKDGAWPRPHGAAASRAGKGGAIGEGDLDILHKCLMQVAGYLCNPATIPTNGRFSPTDFNFANWSEIVGAQLPILAQTAPSTFRAEYTPDGEDIEFRLTPDIHATIRSAKLYLEMLHSMFQKFGTSIDDIVKLPFSISTNSKTFFQILKTFSEIDADQAEENDARLHYAEWRKFQREFNRSSQKIAALMILLRIFPKEKANDIWTSPVLGRISRLIPFEQDITEWPGFRNGALPLPRETDLGSSASIKTFINRHTKTPRIAQASDPGQTVRLVEAIRNWLDGNADRIVTTFADVCAAANDDPVLVVLRTDPAMMTNAEWSRLALLAMPRNDNRPALPGSMAVGALRALGVGGQFLTRLMSEASLPDLAKAGWLTIDRGAGDAWLPANDAAGEIARGAGDGEAATLLITDGSNAITGTPPQPEVKPFFIVSRAESFDYRASITLLRTVGVIDSISAV